MDILLRIIHDFNRLPYHYNVVTLYSLFFQDVLPILAVGCIALGLLLAGYAFTDGAGGPQRAMRRVALAGILSAVGIALYVVVPLWLDALGVTPTEGHVRFYGMFFIPVGAFAGVLAVMVGSWRRLAPTQDHKDAFDDDFDADPDTDPDEDFGEAVARPARISLVAYAIGFVVLWLAFYLYSAAVLGETMIVEFALVRATVTAALGAVLFAAAPYLIHVVERRSWKRILPWGYGLLAGGTLALLVAQVTTLVLNLHVDVL